MAERLQDFTLDPVQPPLIDPETPQHLPGNCGVDSASRLRGPTTWSIVSPLPTPEFIKAPTKEVRLLLRRLRLRHAGVKVDLNVTSLRLGPGGLGDTRMAIHPDSVNDRSVVYSFGVGRDLTWDKEMIRHFGVTIHAFDPTPDTIEWAETTQLPEKVNFHPVGIAAHDGTLKLYPPPTKRTVHYSSINRARAAEEDAIEVPVKRLATIAGELGHDRVDVLKLDVDGSEYEVLPDVLACGLPINQIILEFHHNFREVSFDDTLQAIESLRAHGFGIFDVSHRGLEFGFLKRP